MGIHLILRREGKLLSESEFDGCRFAGDSDLAAEAAELSASFWFDKRAENNVYRLDPAKVREWGAKREYNNERWDLIASLFEKYPDLQMEVSF